MTAPLTLIPVCWRALPEFHNGKNNSGKNLSMKILSYTLEYIDTEIEVNRAQSQMTNGTFPCRLPRRSTGDQISQRTLGKARKKITDTRRHLIEWLALDFPLCNAKAKAHNFYSQWRSIGKIWIRVRAMLIGEIWISVSALLISDIWIGVSEIWIRVSEIWISVRAMNL